jgi:hypothetical protein
MKFTVNDAGKRALLEVDIRFRGDALKEIIFSRDGVLSAALKSIIFLLIFYFAAAFQNMMPVYFPELWLNFTGAAVAYVSCRRSLFKALAAAFLCGLMLDAGSGIAPGPSSLLLLAGAAVSGSMESLKRPHFPGLAAAAAAAIMNLVYVSGMLLCWSGGMPWRLRGMIFLEAGVLGTLLTSFAWAPLLFAFMDFLSPAPPLEAPQHDAEESYPAY